MDNNTWGNINDFKDYYGEEYYEDIWHTAERM